MRLGPIQRRAARKVLEKLRAKSVALLTRRIEMLTPSKGVDPRIPMFLADERDMLLRVECSLVRTDEDVQLMYAYLKRELASLRARYIFLVHISE